MIFTRHHVDSVIAYFGTTEIDLRGADLRWANLSGAYLRGADLRLANLSGANLSGADLRLANLSGADLRLANLSGANLSGAYLSGAYLRGADLSEANLSEANLNYCIGNNNEIKTLQTGVYIVVFYKDKISIGCEERTIKQWENHTDEEIEKMDDKALKFWKSWKNIILEIARKEY